MLSSNPLIAAFATQNQIPFAAHHHVQNTLRPTLPTLLTPLTISDFSDSSSNAVTPTMRNPSSLHLSKKSDASNLFDEKNELATDNKLGVLSLEGIKAEAERLKDDVVRTPLVPLYSNNEQQQIFLKLENRQPIGSFKLRACP